VNWSDYPNFSAQEFDCSHCGQNEMKPEFMAKLQKLRETYGAPMKVTSGYRCPQHPIEAKKASPGAHASGQAVDIGVQGSDAHTLLRMALEEGFTGIGVQQKGTRQVSTLGHARKRFTPYRVELLARSSPTSSGSVHQFPRCQSLARCCAALR
jgi:zinc D-Ala-D-Ala carboxypeptidase